MIFRKLKWRISDYRFNKKMSKQRYKKGFADEDCWNLFNWFQTTFPKMVEDLRDNKHGAAEMEFEEIEKFPLQWVEEQSKILLNQKKENGYEEKVDLWGEDKIFDRWWLILSRIAYCLKESDEFQQTEINEFEEEYNRQVWGGKEELEKLSFKEYWKKHFKVSSYDKKGKPKTYTLVTNEAEPELKEKYYNREKEIFEYRESMKNEAFDLIKKYFWEMWD